MRLITSRVMELQQTVIAWIDRQPMTFAGWLGGVLCVGAIREILEIFGNTAAHVSTDFTVSFFIHFFMVFICIKLGIAACVACCTGSDVRRLIKILLFGLPIVWIAPAFNLLLTWGKGTPLSYIGGDPAPFLKSFFLFLTPWSLMAPGLVVELIVIVILAGLYGAHVRNSTVVALKTAAAVYCWLFFTLAFPGFLYILTHLGTPDILFDVFSPHFHDWFAKIFEGTVLDENRLDPMLQFLPSSRVQGIQFNYLSAQISYFEICVLGLWWFRNAFAAQFRAVMANARPERVAFFHPGGHQSGVCLD